MARGPRPDRRRAIRGRSCAIVVALCQLTWAACARPDNKARDIVIGHRVSADPFVLDRDSVFEFSLYDVGGKRIEGASLTVEASMTHPGMTPIVVPVVHVGEGTYKATLRFTMAGDWVLDLKGTLPDRRVLDQRLGGGVTVRPAG